MHKHYHPSFWLLIAAIAVLCAGPKSHLSAQVPSFQTPYVTRAEAVMLLLQAKIAKVPPLMSNGAFPDVPKNAWYERYIVAAERLGIIQANPITHRIRPEDPITRAEFIAMAARAFGINTRLFGTTYTDVPADAWYIAAAGMSQRLHLFPADPYQNTLKPNEFMIHSEAAQADQILIDATASGKNSSLLNLPPSPPPSIVATRTFSSVSSQAQSSVAVKPPAAAAHAAAGAVSARPVDPTADPAQMPRLRDSVFTLVNMARAAEGLPALKRNPTLEGSAQLYATKMAKENFFGHISPDGETLYNRMEQSGYYQPFFQFACLCIARFIMGENLAQGQISATQVVQDWLNSPSHRAAILNTDFTDTGIGVANGVWVEHFGGRQK